MSSSGHSARRFDTLLVANRGEIAIRIMRTAKQMGLRTVAVYSDADRASPHVKVADVACRIGPPSPRESYLSIQSIVRAAVESGAQAIHPGYGFLAENAEFAAAIEEAGLIFVGPSADAIRLMGNKAAAKERMIEAGVPCISGYQGRRQDDETLIREASLIGYPIMVKAAAGGGGRGMRLAVSASDLPEALRSARSEAMAAFGSGELILERAIGEARHVEIQVFADSHGNAIYLGDRDCSVQRRHQKLIEESPSPAVDDALRARMGAASVTACHAIKYQGAGTLEFLVGQTGEFWFMEMNTRLQVEHGVTELVTGLDLVEWQLRIAQGEMLPRTQTELLIRGHAMEVRLCAEDEAQDFMPQTGDVLAWEPADGARVDHALEVGLSISPYYDSMIAKLMAYGATREECVAKLRSYCDKTVLLGVRHNLSFLSDCLTHPEFAQGSATTSFVARHFSHGEREIASPPIVVDVAAVILFGKTYSADNWTNAQGLGARVDIASEGCGRRYYKAQRSSANTIHISPLGENVEAKTFEVTNLTLSSHRLEFEFDGKYHRLVFAFDGSGALWLQYSGGQYTFRDMLNVHDRLSNADIDGGVVRAPLSGRVVKISAQIGERVEKGAPLVTIESMKMEHSLTAAGAGILTELSCAIDAQVAAGAILARINLDSVKGDVCANA